MRTTSREYVSSDAFVVAPIRLLTVRRLKSSCDECILLDAPSVFLPAAALFRDEVHHFPKKSKSVL